MLKLILSSGEVVSTRLLDEKDVRFVQPSHLPAKGINEAYDEALRAPIECKSIYEEEFQKPMVIFSDSTRIPSPFVPLLAEYLDGSGEIKLMCACGTHNPPNEEPLH